MRKEAMNLPPAAVAPKVNMKNRIRTTALRATVCLVAAVSSAAFAQQAQRVGPLKVTAGEIVFKKNQWTLSGNRPHLFAVDGSFDVRADKIVVDFAAASKGVKIAKDSIGAVTATGAVEFVSKKPGQSAQVQAPKAVTRRRRTLVLSGGVKGTVSDPSLPATTPITAERLTVWLDSARGRSRLRIEAPGRDPRDPKEQLEQD